MCTETPLYQKHLKVQVLVGWLVWVFLEFLAHNLHGVFTFYYKHLFYLRSKKSLAHSHKLGKAIVLACIWNCLLYGHKSCKLSSVSDQRNDFLGWYRRQKLCDPFAKFELKMYVVMAFSCLGYGSWVSEGFCKHLLKCGYFYNLSNTILEGGRSAYFIIVAKPCYWMTAVQDHRAPRILLDLVVQTGQWSFILCCCLMHYITNALVKTVVCKSLEESHKWLTHCLPHSEILLQVTAFVLLI